MSICLYCKERFMCDRVLYDCPREENDRPIEGKDELTIKQKSQWLRLIEEQRRKTNEAL